MVQFFGKILAYATIVLGIYLYFAYGKVTTKDGYYWKSTYQASTMVIGSSRAAQGVAPTLLQESLDSEKPALNFAFSGIDSPYGKQYFELIQRKVKPGTTNGVFVLCVSPGMVMVHPTAAALREHDFRFYDLYTINSSPNWEYMIRDIHPVRFGQVSFLARLLTERKDGRQDHEQDGWGPVTGVKELERKKEKLPNSLEVDLKRSPEREHYLEETMRYLATFGDIYLVRLPVGPLVYAREQELFPDFNDWATALAKEHDTHYFNYGEGDYVKHDPAQHHLEASSARQLTQDLAKAIRSVRNQSK